MATPYLTASQVRTYQPTLADTVVFPDATLALYVAEFEEIAEEYLNVAFTPRTQVDTYYPRSDRYIILGKNAVRSITSVTSDGVTQATNTYTLSYDQLILLGGVSTMNVAGPTIVVTYSHGLDAPSNTLLRACAEYVRSTAMQTKSQLPRDVIGQQMSGGAYTRYSTPDRNSRRPTGWLEVDRLLNMIPAYKTGIA